VCVCVCLWVLCVCVCVRVCACVCARHVHMQGAQAAILSQLRQARQRRIMELFANECTRDKQVTCINLLLYGVCV